MIEHFLKISLERNRIITIIYQKGSEITLRNIKVVAFDGEYVIAFCYLRNQRRVFNRRNILSAALYTGSAGGNNSAVQEV